VPRSEAPAMTPADRYHEQSKLEQARLLEHALNPCSNPLWQLRERPARLRRALWYLFLAFGVCAFALGALVATAMWRYL
ncbi:MAG: hypothetical protein GY788_28520, partial [bacterium]|nr:hypothetical protein [bacterium]